VHTGYVALLEFVYGNTIIIEATGDQQEYD
jgi:hypothetical protein